MARTKRGVTLDEVVELAKRLTPAEQARLIERVAPEIARALSAGRPEASVSLLGLLKDLGPAPSAEAIDRARREAWADYDPEAVANALDETIGSWADVDVDGVIARIYRWREEGSRPTDRP